MQWNGRRAAVALIAPCYCVCAACCCSENIDGLTIPSKTGRGVLKRVPEVFDCWFESGSMPYAQVHYPFEKKVRPCPVADWRIVIDVLAVVDDADVQWQGFPRL